MKPQQASVDVLEGNVLLRCTLADMIENDVLDHGIGQKHTTDGFSIGKRGKARFYMFDPTPNGYYKIYQQDESGNVIGLRYVDANKTLVTVWKNNTQTKKQ